MFADLVIAIEERHRMLPDELDSTERKFNSQALPRRRIPESQDQVLDGRESRSNDLLRKILSL